ncbi:MAG: hypothetical protein K6A32_01330 [Bacteroidales bacterium]|nr:hypothetical protein [Bacteroidales bacterium]
MQPFNDNLDLLNRVALRYQALCPGVRHGEVPVDAVSTPAVMAVVRSLVDNGFCVNEELLRALTLVPSATLQRLTAIVGDVMGVNLNWAPLVKGWDVPTGESLADHFITFFANLMDEGDAPNGTRLPCGHLIPDHTFPLERYNGCPFCGKPFQLAREVFTGQASRLKELRLMDEDDMRKLLQSLLTSAVPLDATQRESLAALLHIYGLPEKVAIAMKETAMQVVQMLVADGRDDEAASLLATPTDILRYLWFEKTGNFRILEPRTLVRHASRLNQHMWQPADHSEEAADVMRHHLRLKYDRPTCRRFAFWMNALPMKAAEAAEMMNAKRRMWVRVIRALRLPEFAKRRGFEPLAALLDVFYRRDYTTWQGRVDAFRAQHDSSGVLNLLSQRPGLFARALFATMLRFGPSDVMAAFAKVADRLPARLLLSLVNAAEMYFDPREQRLARPLTGGTFSLPAHPLLKDYSEDERRSMVRAIADLYRTSMRRRFSASAVPADAARTRSIFIDPRLFEIPLAVGDRSTTVQDTSCALMGQRFAVEGDAVRLFLQWGKGLHEQPLDMDLSCRIAYEDGHVEECAYYNLKCTGAKHSGDIRWVPEMVGTAEYVELSLPELAAAGARYVTFTCNAYSNGALSPNLVVGWMNSAYPMAVSEKNGVAYDPSCVQHAVRISAGNLSKGLVFGVLEVARREIVWLEMPFTAQTLFQLDSSVVESLLKRLKEKVTIGELLQIKAEAQQLQRIGQPQDDAECYTLEWALDAASVSQLLNL